MKIRPLLTAMFSTLFSMGCAMMPLDDARTAAPQNMPSSSSENVMDELPPQNLNTGECGIFFWSADARHRFLAFENLSSGLIRVHADGQSLDFFSPNPDEAIISGRLYERRFTHAETGLDIQLSGTIASGSANGFRIEPGFLRQNQQDGSRLIIPIIGHYTCISDEG